MQNLNNEPIFSVKQITLKIKERLESKEFSNLSISGEVSNCSISQSGHLFFNLKEVDNNDQYLLKAVVWKNNLKYLNFPLKDGDKIICKGRISLYNPAGEYRLIIESIKLSGEGEFFKKFLELKEKLMKEGLFSPERKKPIPSYPQKIGIITSETGAALQDIINIIKTRAPHIDIYIFPVLVQGDMASRNISDAIIAANDRYGKILDLLILARGGGSIEDLWPFNEEIVARTIVDSTLPIVTGIGHETDFTIADFVGDLRAPTPTGAAAMICQSILNAKDFLSKSEERLKNAVNRIYRYYNEKTSLKQYLRHCSLIIQSKMDNLKMRVDSNISKLVNLFNNNLTNSKTRLITSIKLLNSLSPISILKRGYSITKRIDGKIIKSIDDVNNQDSIETILSKGALISVIKEIKS